MVTVTAESPFPWTSPATEIWWNCCVVWVRSRWPVPVGSTAALLAAAHATLGERVLALTAMTPYMASWEMPRLGNWRDARRAPPGAGITLAAEIAHNPRTAVIAAS